ncbi:MAG: type II toxin-antitoxin system VapC family toxin [Roseiarcus sp.]
MNILLDTQVAIWALAAPERVSEKSRQLIVDPGNDVFVSAVSVAEIAIEYRLGKRVGAPPFSAERALEFFRAAGFSWLPLTADHAAALEALPEMPVDPLDRLLIAQALYEPLRLMTADSQLMGINPSIMPA